MRVILTGLIILSGLLTIRAKTCGFRSQLFIFKPMTTVWIICIAVVSCGLPITEYSSWIIVGLLFSLVGDVLLMFPQRFFVAGLLSFFITHILYIMAFTTDVSLRLSLWIALPFILFGCFFYGYLFAHLGKLKLPVLLYVVAIIMMIWQVWERWMLFKQSEVLCAAIGASLFVISDSILAFNKFKKAFRNAELLILSGYFTGQWLIALSVS